MSNLTILNTSIRTYENLYSLNDLHKVGGNDPKHQPSFFVRNDQTKALIDEIKAENVSSANSQSLVVISKNGVGTYACEELALAYAMWISPKFHLVVLRAFIAMHKGEAKPQQIALPEPKPDVVLSHIEAERIAKYIVLARAFAKEIEVYHRNLFKTLNLPSHTRNELAGRAYDIACEFNVWLDPFIEQVIPQIPLVKNYAVLPRR